MSFFSLSTAVLRMPLRVGIFVATSLVLAGGIEADEPPTTAREALATLEKEVLPVVEKYCLECHDAETAKADIDLDRMWDAGGHQLDLRLWWVVEDQLRIHAMPPKDKPQPKDEERTKLLEWIRTAERAVRAAEPADPGARPLRRMTRHEFSNTVRDLLGIAGEPGEKFPVDGSGGEGFDNNADTLFIPPLLLEKYFAAAEEIVEDVFSKPELKSRFLAQVPSEALKDRDAAEANVRALLPRAYRRPVLDEEVSDILAQFESGGQKGGFEGGMRRALKAVLLSPKFLFLQEQERPGAGEPWKVGDYELASRLSYFLWSSMPDEELFSLAEQKKLHDPAVLEQQVLRMLKDSKAEALTEHFAGRWLEFEEVYNTVDPDRGKYTAFNEELRRAMYDETHAFMDAILRENGNLLDLLDSDYTYANEILAKHYGLPGVTGTEMRKVSFTDKRRGGLTGMSAILAATSYPQRTSPVLRGRWVLETLMGTPPPPPPDDVGSLPEDDRVVKDLTFRQKLEKHRDKAECRGCHDRMDPLGFGLENFDPIGAWRDNENGKPLDVSGELPTGEKFAGPEALRKVLLENREQYVRNVTSRMMGYAYGRGLEPFDQPTQLRLMEALEKNGYRSNALTVGIVKSYAFTHRKNPLPGEGEETK